MFSNKTTTPEFENFLNILGEKINLETWNGYRGDMGKEGETYYRKWNDFDLIFHVSTLMDSEQHRRLIGNDVAVIFFKDSNVYQTAFDISKIDLGTVPQVHCVVEPCKVDGTTFYRTGFFSRTNVKPFGPKVPVDHLFDADSLRDFIFTKIANGYATAFLCPPLNRLYFKPRFATIETLVKQFPKGMNSNNRSQIKSLDNQIKSLRSSTLMNGGAEVFLQVEVLGARDLAPNRDYYVELIFHLFGVKRNKMKTRKILKKY